MDIVWWVGIIITVATAIPVLLQLRTHPKGLVILFFVEMWERFSYYGMRGLLIFYLTQHFLFEDKAAASQYGSYTSLVYLLPLVGGLLADRFLGTRKSVLFGALLLVAGHLTMAIEGPPAVQILNYNNQSYEFVVQGRGDAREVKLKLDESLHAFQALPDGSLKIEGATATSAVPELLAKGSYSIEVAKRDPAYLQLLYLALALIIMGVAFLKPNISSLAGQLYGDNDPRRDPGFTLYYYGMNLGSFWAGLGCGWLGQQVGWWAGFGAAGVGMLAGYAVFLFGQKTLGDKGHPPEPAKLAKPILGPINLEYLIYAAGLAGVGAIMVILSRADAVRNLLSFGSVGVLAYLGYVMATKCSVQERKQLTLALVLIAASVIFWTLSEQAGSSLNLFAERNTQLALTASQSLNAAQTQSFNPGFLLIGAPLFAGLWAWLGQRNLDPHPALKFAIAIILVGASFLLGAYMLQTFGELLLSPVGLSQMTRLSPAFLIATVMATWFLALSWAQWLGSLLAGLASSDTVGGKVLDPAEALATYAAVFAQQGWVTVGLGIALAAATPLLARLSRKSSAPQDS
jgi:POT family proton-dependent oligopeptide transporter